MHISKRICVESFLDGVGTRYESHLRRINGTTYEFKRTTYANGWRMVTSAPLRGLNIDGHVWTSDN